MPAEPAANTLDITFFVPCYNEEAHVATTLAAIVDASSAPPVRYEILLVDDGSTDGTTAVAEHFATTHPSVPLRIHRNPSNQGLSRSFGEGAALAKGRYYKEVCGDHTEDATALRAILAWLGKVDLVIPYYTEIEGKSPLRRAISRAYTGAVNSISGHRLHYYNGLPVFPREDAARWCRQSYGMGFQAELLCRCLDAGRSFVEVPVKNMHRAKGDDLGLLRPRSLLSVASTFTQLLKRRMARDRG